LDGRSDKNLVVACRTADRKADAAVRIKPAAVARLDSYGMFPCQHHRLSSAKANGTEGRELLVRSS